MLNVLYWNTRTIARLTHKALWAQGEFDIIALQEPNILRHKAPANPRGSNYIMVYGKGKAVLYIHKRHHLGKWTAQTGENWCSVTFLEEDITVFSIYNPNQATSLSTPLRYITESPPTGRIVLVGDFNLHHPLWDQYNRESALSEDLLLLAEQLNLCLITPKGEVTRFAKGQRDSTIDLAWASRSLPIQYIGSVYELTGSDHVAQHIRIGVEEENAQTPYFRWRELDPILTEAEAKVRFNTASPPMNPEDLDKQVDQLVKDLEEIATLAVPKRARKFTPRPPWWSCEVRDAIALTRRTRRRFRARPNSLPEYEAMRDAERNEKRVIGEAMRKSWREFTAEASKKPTSFWALERWARLHSGQPPTPAHLPELNNSEHLGSPARTFQEKAQILAQRFFPEESEGAAIVPDLEFHDTSFTSPTPIEINCKITAEDVIEVIKRTKPWKAPGNDGIPAGFLKACGCSLAEKLATLIQASLDLEWFPSRFRNAKVVVLPKPGKTPQQKLNAAGWRPISLLNTIGKIFEATISSRITTAAEEFHLLPDEQMGNRANRSTILAVQVLLEAVKSTWNRGGVASLLQLDLKGAFDMVSHNHLLHTLRQLGFPPKIVRWLKSYLALRTANLHFDGQVSETIRIARGVPQGSPLSPILFILFIGTLYTRLYSCRGILVVGFADDTNLLSIARDTQQTTRQLADAWETCDNWAKDMGMQFEPTKSELMHFTRTRAAATNTLEISNTTLHPVKETRFLGVWLQRKLLWGNHLRALKKRLSVQQRALTGIAASTWGCALEQAREVYTKVIRAAIAYGAVAYHTPTEPQGKPKGIARSLMSYQSQCLRIVLGAYRATPVRHLEVEAGVPPLDIYLNTRVAAYTQRLEDNGMAAILSNTSTKVASLIRRRRRQPPNRRPNEETQQWAQRWAGSENTKCIRLQIARQEWSARWANQTSRNPPRYLGDTQAADINPSFQSKEVLLKHKNHPKYISSAITQLRTGRVGLKAFLFQRRVPDINTPICSCGEAPETTYHIFIRCPLMRIPQEHLPTPLRTSRDLRTALDNKDLAGQLALWFLKLYKLPQFFLALKLHPG